LEGWVPYTAINRYLLIWWRQLALCRPQQELDILPWGRKLALCRPLKEYALNNIRGIIQELVLLNMGQTTDPLQTHALIRYY